MKKKVILLFSMLLILIITLCACGQNQADVSNDVSTEIDTNENVTDSEASVIKDTNTYDVGDFSVTIPDGWMVYPQTDTFAEKDANGESPAKSDSIGIVKGGTSLLDVFSKPVVYAYLYDVSAEEEAELSVTGTLASSFYSEVNEIEVSINGVSCLAYEVKEASFLDETKHYVYQYIFYPVSESACIHFIIPVDMIDFDGVSYEDSDVMEFITSVSVH